MMQKFVHRVLLYMPDINNINGAHAVGTAAARHRVFHGRRRRQRACCRTGQRLSALHGRLAGFHPGIQDVDQRHSGRVRTFFRRVAERCFQERRERFPWHRSKIATPAANCVTATTWSSPASRRRSIITNGARSASGPIVRDKTFWFFGFQQHYEKLAETVTTTVPSPEMLSGDFNFGGRGLPIYDPDTLRRDDAGNWIRDPFPGNRIPQNRFDPVAVKVLALKPWMPQSSAGDVTANGPNNNLEGDFAGLYKFERYDAKIDHQFSTVHKIFGRYSRVRHRSEERPVRGLTDPLQFGNVTCKPLDFHNIVVSDTYTFNPTTINEMRAGFNRRAFYRRSGDVRIRTGQSNSGSRTSATKPSPIF